jgi:ribosome-associated translation inhibitor RaiA
VIDEPYYARLQVHVKRKVHKPDKYGQKINIIQISAKISNTKFHPDCSVLSDNETLEWKDITSALTFVLTSLYNT